MADNRTSRPKGKKGALKGSGGKNRRRLEGKGPTPKAEDRTYHPAYKKKQAADAAKRSMEARTAPRALRPGLQLQLQDQLAADEFGKLGDQTRRQVVDAKVAHVLEHMHGLRSARSRHSGDDDDIGDALRALRRIHGISLLHVLPPENKRGTQQPGSRAVNCLY